MLSVYLFALIGIVIFGLFQIYTHRIRIVSHGLNLISIHMYLHKSISILKIKISALMSFNDRILILSQASMTFA